MKGNESKRPEISNKKSWVALGAMKAIREKIEEDEEILLDFEFIIDNQPGKPIDVTFKFTFKEDE